MQKCCVQSCNATEIKQRWHRGKDARGQAVTYVARVCDSCKDALGQKPVDFSYYRVGNLLFVEKIHGGLKS